MKIAFCLYGQARDFSRNWDRILASMSNVNEVDYFFHTWYDPSDTSIHKLTPGHENRKLESDLPNKLLSSIKPKRYKIEKQIPFSEKLVPVTDENIQSCWSYSINYDKDRFIRDRVKCSYSMWYSINQSILMKELYSQENQFIYDCVVLSRFDVASNKVLDFESFDLNNITSGYKTLPREEVNDWFLVCNNNNSNIISSIFYFIDYYRDKLIENNGIWTNEAYLRDHLKKYNIIVDYRDDLQVSF